MEPALSQADIETGRQWIIDLYRMSDLKDSGMVSKYFAEDVVVNFSNAPPLVGVPVVERLFNWEYGACKSLTHDIDVNKVVVMHDQIYVPISATYHFLNGKEETVKCFSVWQKKPTDQKCTKMDLYGDFNSVIKELEDAGGPFMG